MVLYHNLDGATHFFILFASLVVQLQGFLDSKLFGSSVFAVVQMCRAYLETSSLKGLLVSVMTLCPMN